MGQGIYCVAPSLPFFLGFRIDVPETLWESVYDCRNLFHKVSERTAGNSGFTKKALVAVENLGLIAAAVIQLDIVTVLAPKVNLTKENDILDQDRFAGHKTSHLCFTDMYKWVQLKVICSHEKRINYNDNYVQKDKLFVGHVKVILTKQRQI